ncbi:Tankyrase-2 [Tolypocladium ophioglossoides CBS 100239]|uniref:Tankyrase-2 n=1 Tax=Tolypocladium ophioglossoides (strain CBS 100239) TaxID=1163406 RepID=A0A0L0NBM6_TOLOC|nr:Tankyrase-2 [Tolypocladium ophioglossoides CBS 100239]
MTSSAHLLAPPPELVKFAAERGVLQYSDEEKTPLAVLAAMKACDSDLTTFAPLFDSWKLEYSYRRGRLWFHEVNDVFFESIDNKYEDIVRYMLQGGLVIGADEVVRAAADPNARCAIDLTSLSNAVRLAPMSTINLLFDRGGDATKGELLHHAMQREDDMEVMLQAITLLLDKGSSINRNMYEDDELGMKMCTIMSMTPLHNAAIQNMVDVVSLLVQRGADVHKLDNAGATRRDGKLFTPLEYAARWSSWDVYDYLLQFEPEVHM